MTVGGVEALEAEVVYGVSDDELRRAMVAYSRPPLRDPLSNSSATSWSRRS